MAKQRNDNKDGQRGDFYQVLVALKYALEYTEKPFKLISLEHFGDVTFDNFQQIEVKHHSPKGTLGDYHIDFWKTLFNWCSKNNNFEKLILHTTSSFPSTRSLLKSWNKQNKEEKYRTIKSLINSNTAEGVKVYIEFIDKMEEETLKSIVEKIEIKTDQLNDVELVSQLSNNPTIQVVACKPEDREELIKNRIAGFIQAKVAGENRWEVTWQQLINIIQSISRDFLSQYYNPIFDKYDNKDLNVEDYEEYKEKKFVTELTNISCEEDEVRDAINDYWKTTTLLAEGIENDPSFDENEFQPFKNKRVYPMLINRKRISASEKPNDSLYFYRKAKEANVGSYKSIPDHPYFKHGTMNIIVEDDNLKFSWLYD